MIYRGQYAGFWLTAELWRTMRLNYMALVQYIWKPGLLCDIGYPHETHLNTLRPGQNRRHFADDIFKCIFWNENVWTPIKISLKFVPQGQNLQYSSIGSDNGLSPDGSLTDAYALLGLNGLNSNLTKCCSSITSAKIILSFWNSDHCTAMLWPWSKHNLKLIGLLMNKLWANQFTRDWVLR